MAQCSIRVDLSDAARDFRPLAVEPGLPMLDRPGTNAKIVARWLGRFAAEPRWDGECVEFCVRDAGGGLWDAACRPVTAGRLRGALRGEVEQLQEQLRKARPTLPVEQSLHRLLGDALQSLLAGRAADPGCHLFEYRDPEGKWRVVWCWGYQPIAQRRAAPIVCGNPRCKTLFVRAAGRAATCPSCGYAPVLARPGWKRAVAAALLLALLAAGAWFWWHSRPSAVLAGRVVNAENQRRLPDAEVRILDSDFRARTDELGEFYLDRLPAGPLKVEVVADGYEPKTLDVETAAGRELRLVVELGGRAFPKGRVVDAAKGAPVAEARVTLEGPDGLTVLTDRDGQFRFPGVTGARQIQAVAPGYRPQTVSWSGEAGTMLIKLAGGGSLKGRVLGEADGRPIARAKVRDARTGQAAETDSAGQFRLDDLRGGNAKIEVAADGFAEKSLPVEVPEAGEKTVEVRLAGAAALVGRVLNAATGTPLAGALVRIDQSPHQTKTDAQGKLAFQSVPGGPAKIVISAPGFSPQELPQTLSADRKTDLGDVPLVGAATLAVKTVDADSQESVAGTALSVEGTNLKGETDKDGACTLAGVPSRTPVTLRVAAAGFGDEQIARQFPDGSTPLSVAMVRETTLTVRVVDKAAPEQPVADAKIRLVGANLKREAATDAKGEAAFRKIPARPLAIEVSAKDYCDERVEKKPGRQQDEIRVELAKGATLMVKVLRAVDKKSPVPGAEVRLADGRKAEVLGDAQQRIAGLRPGTVKLAVSAPGFRSEQVAKDIPSGTTATDVLLTGAAQVGGFVNDAAEPGKRVARATVRLTNGGAAQETQTDDRGRFVFWDVAAAPVELEATAAGYFPERLSRAIAEGRTTLDIALRPETELEALVVDARTKDPIAGALVKLAAAGAPTKTTDAAGKALFSRIAAGPAQLDASAAGYCDRRVEQVLTAGKSAVTIPLLKGHVVRGLIVNALDNRPVSGATVEVSVAGTKQTAVTDARGAYEVKGVPGGAGTIAVRAAGFNAQEVAGAVGGAEAPIRVVLNPELARGEMRAVLTWGKFPRDLDLHLYGPGMHVFHKNRTSGPGKLDVDCKEGEGPETITVTGAPAGRYACWVEDAANAGRAGHGELLQSGAEVKVYYYGAKEPKTFLVKRVQTPAGPVWHACDIQVRGGGEVEVSPGGKLVTNLPQEP